MLEWVHARRRPSFMQHCDSWRAHRGQRRPSVFRLWSAGPRHGIVVSHISAHRRWAVLDGAGGLCAEYKSKGAWYAIATSFGTLCRRVNVYVLAPLACTTRTVFCSAPKKLEELSRSADGGRPTISSWALPNLDFTGWCLCWGADSTCFCSILATTRTLKNVQQ